MLLHLHIYTYLDTSLRATSPRLQTPILRQHRPFFGWRTLAVIIFIFSLVGGISPGFLSPFPDKCRCDGPRSGGRVKQTASVLQSEAFSAKAHKGKVRHRKWSGGGRLRLSTSPPHSLAFTPPGEAGAKGPEGSSAWGAGGSL